MVNAKASGVQCHATADVTATVQKLKNLSCSENEQNTANWSPRPVSRFKETVIRSRRHFIFQQR